MTVRKNSSRKDSSKTGLIIFDFDGVLADSFDALSALTCNAMNQLDISFNSDDYRALFKKNFHRGINDFFLGDAKNLDKLVQYKKSHFSSYYKQVKLFPFSKNIVQILAQNFHLAIVSSTEKKYIKKLLEKNSLLSSFFSVYGSSSKSKKQALLELLKNIGNPPDKTFFVTDTAGDVQEGKICKLQTLAVAWGFHSETTLKTALPKKIFKHWQELLVYFSTLKN